MTSSAAIYSPPTALALHTDPLASSFATIYAGVEAFIAVVTEGSFARAAFGAHGQRESAPRAAP